MWGEGWGDRSAAATPRLPLSPFPSDSFAPSSTPTPSSTTTPSSASSAAAREGGAGMSAPASQSRQSHPRSRNECIFDIAIHPTGGTARTWHLYDPLGAAAEWSDAILAAHAEGLARTGGAGGAQ